MKHCSISSKARVWHFLIFFVGFSISRSCRAQTADQLATPTIVNVGSTVKMSSVRRLGINLGQQTYYDSAQMMKNLVYRNPGFEAETWQSTLHCAVVTSNSCTDDNLSSVWPAGFFTGAQVEVLTGSAVGQTAAVTTNTAASKTAGVGITVTFANDLPIAVGDFLVVRMNVPGNPAAGWWTKSTGGAIFSSETVDLSPETVGAQALRINALATNASATLNSYFDTSQGISFIQMNGLFTLTFRAKGVGGTNKMIAQVARNSYFLLQTVQLSNTWQDYSITFPASESGAIGTIALTFKVSGAAVLIDDVSLQRADSSNTTVFRDEVVSALQKLHPGILRYMDSGTDWGSSLDNMLAPPFARLRAGYSNRNVEQDDIPIGLHEFLALCQVLGAEPWYTLQTGMSTQEMTNLMEYLGGSTSTTYGAKRAALGQTAPWTSVFKTIHFELGNEVWNTANPGASMNDYTKYGERASTVFATAHQSPYYSADGFDLILDGWSSVSAWTTNVLASSSNYDSVGIGPYIYGTLNDVSSPEAIYGPMFAQPEAFDSVSGGLVQVNAQAAASAKLPAKLAVYETNLGTIAGGVTQAQINSVVPSVGGSIAQADHMLLMMRDLGINNQNMFSLAGYQAAFLNTVVPGTKTPLWGVVFDMGNTNRLRPAFLAEQLVNSAILPSLLTTTQSGSNPTWNQASTVNSDVSLSGAHYIQTFAFTDGTNNNLVVFNLSRSTALPVVFTGPNAPLSDVSLQTLTSTNPTDGNESSATVGITSSTATIVAGRPLTFPPFSMTVISAAAPQASISNVVVSCTPDAVNVIETVTCSSTVNGTGTFTSGVTWATSYGTISSTGVYITPATAPASRQVVITAVSNEDPTVSGSAIITVLPPAIKTVAVTCAATSLITPSSTTCSSAVTGLGDFSSAVTWSVSAGSITTDGVYTTPAVAPSSGKVTITATSAEDPTHSASTTIAVSSITSISVSCSVSTLTASSATVCAAPVRGIGSFNTASTLSVDYGSINSIGLFTAPSTVPPSGKATITAVSVQDPTKIARTTVSIIAQAGAVRAVYVSCLPSFVNPGTVSVCSAKVSGVGAANRAVIWRTTAGTISSSGVLTVPEGVLSMEVTATSVQTPTVVGSALVNTLGAPLISPPAVSNLTPTSVTISWTTSLLTANGIDYGLTTRLGGLTPNAPLSSTPSFTLTGLVPGSLYYIHIRSSNYGTQTGSAFTITTPAN